MRSQTVFAIVLAHASCTYPSDPQVHTNMTSVLNASGPPGSVQRRFVPRGTATFAPVWTYWDQGPLPDDWMQPAFDPDEQAWPRAHGPFGYRDPDVHTRVDDGQVTTYYRIRALVPSGAVIHKMYLCVLFDDGFAFYINGHEAGRAYVPLTGPIEHDTLATSHDSGGRYYTYDITAQWPHIQTGEFNTFAFEVHQDGASADTAVFDAELIAWVGDVNPPVPNRSSLTIRRDDHWRFYDRGAAPAGWNELGFDDRAWSSAAGELGFGEYNLVGNIEPGEMTAYFRNVFTADPDDVRHIYADVRFDDGYVIYLNGVSISEANMGGAGPYEHSSPARWSEAGDYARLDVSNAHTLLTRAYLDNTELIDAPNVLAVEVHQELPTSSDLVWGMGLILEPTWHRQNSGTTADLHDVWFDVPEVWYAGGDESWASRGLVVGDGGTILSTTDGGHTWSAIEAGTAANLVALESTDPMTAWIAGDDGTVLRTVTGGDVWASVPVATGDDLIAISAADAARAYVVSTTTLYRTTDGGTTWSPLDPGAGVASLIGVAAIQEPDEQIEPHQELDAELLDDVWVAALDDEGRSVILRSGDGGDTWATVWRAEADSSGRSPTLRDLQYNDGERGSATIVAVGVAGDGDAFSVAHNLALGSWHTSRPIGNVGDGLTGVWHSRNYRGLAVTEHGGIAALTNNYWSARIPIESDVDVRLNAASERFAVGDDGTIIKVDADAAALYWP